MAGCIVFFLLACFLPRSAGLCPPGFYLSGNLASCAPCEPCPPSFQRLSPCGPGDNPGVCGSGLQIDLLIGGVEAARLNLTVALANYSGYAGPASDATGLDVILRPCPTVYEYRSLVDFLCRPCQTCRPPTPVEAGPCVTASDRVCIPPIAVMLQANGTDLILDPSLLIRLLSTLAINGFNASFSYATYNQVYVTRIPCPPDHYRSKRTGACTPCTPCPPLTLQSAPCTPDADRACGTSLVSGFLMNGAPFAGQIAGDWDLSLFQTGPGGDPLVIPTAPCPPNRFRSPLDGTCRACAVCAPGEVQLRNCSSAGDRVCAGPVQIDLSALAAAGVNTSRLDLQALQGVLAAALTASQPVPLPAQLPLAPGNVISLRITPQPCQSHAYLNLTSLACHPCTTCPQAQFMTSTCQIDADAVCQACRICGTLETVVRDCSARADRVCGGSMGVRVFVANSTTLNRTLLVDELLGRLLAGLPQGSRVDASYLRHWEAVFSVVAGAYAGYDVEVERLRCTSTQYADAATQRCLPCTPCAASAYLIAPCGNVSDAVCAPCATCAAGQYEACPCGPRANGTCSSGNRVCYAYAGVNVSINATFVAPYTAADLSVAYLPAMREHIRAQTLAAAVVVQVTESARFDGVALPDADGTTAVFYGTPAVQRTLHPIAGIQRTDVLRHRLGITLGVLYAMQTNRDRDFTGLIERALRSAESFLVPAAVLNGSSARRRLLAASGNDTTEAAPCPADSYLVSYPVLEQSVCVPCQNDPILAADAGTPPALRWELAPSPCPLDSARVCQGGYAPPQCVARFAGALVISATGSEPVPLACPSGQAAATDPATGGFLCVGIPCAQGYTGIPGYCGPCAPGTYKPTVGSALCDPCPAGTYAALEAAAGLQDCLPCRNHSTSLAGASQCTCDAGYTGPTCSPCAPGTYKFLPGNASCAPCEQGGQSPAPASLHCHACPNGTFAATSGLSACADCGRGSYQNGTGASACVLCAPGHASRPLPPRTDCLGCRPGSYSRDPGADACPACPAGSYSQAVSTACDYCPNGTGVTGQACAPCWRGEYGLGGVCLPCAPGSYGASYGVTACVPCPTGGYSVAPGATSVVQCLACAENAYWTARGCIPCPDNTAAPRGVLSQRDCLAVPGYYGLPGQRALACPAGSYCPQASMVPSKCPDGSTSAQGSRACIMQPQASTMHQFDWIVAASWFVVTFLGVACLARTKRFWRGRLAHAIHP